MALRPAHIVERESMIVLEHDRLVFQFPDVHPETSFSISFQRTLRIPDDGSDYPLPPGLGAFPLRLVDDLADSLPACWREHGGVIIPMYQAEAMWLSFEAGIYPFAVKIATGKINAVNGGPWSRPLNKEEQDYVVLPDQPWLDGYCVEKGVIRQFVAAPRGKGVTVEEQVTGRAESGGLQILAYPLKAAKFADVSKRVVRMYLREQTLCEEDADFLGLAAGGRMRQHIYEDEYKIEDWDQEHGRGCFITIIDSVGWTRLTGEPMPTSPIGADEYAKAGLPWFDYYSAAPALDGAKVLAGVKSIGESWVNAPVGGGGLKKPVKPAHVVQLGRRPVREMQD
jgi:hypothetical protein